MNSLADDSRPLLDVGARESYSDSGAWVARKASRGKVARRVEDRLAGDRSVEEWAALDETKTERVEAPVGGDARADVTSASEAARYRKLALVTIAMASLIRVVTMLAIPLGNGEAYYYTWSKFPDWSYYDHPPLIAWMVRLTTIFGHSPTWVRLGPMAAAAVFGYLFYRLAERLTRPRAAYFALLILTAVPVFLASSFIVNPEAPLAPLWVAYLLVVLSMREREDRWLPLLAGVLLGVAFLAKYTAVLLVPATLVYAVISAPMRRWLRRPAFYAGGGIALAFASPVLFWNQTHDWASVKLHLVERASVGVPAAGDNTVNHLVAISSSAGTGLFESIGRLAVGQTLSYSPLLVPLLVLALAAALRGALRKNDRDLFLAAFTWPVLLPLLASMVIMKDSEQHWTMMAFVPAILGAGAVADGAWSKRRGGAARSFAATQRPPLQARWIRGLFVSGLAVSAIAFVLIHLHARTTAVVKLLPAGDYDPQADIVSELSGWDELRPALRSLTSRRNVVLASNQPALCGRLLYEMGDSPAVYCASQKRSAFDFWSRREPPAEASVVLLTTATHPELPQELATRRCDAPEPIDIGRGDMTVARYFVRTCEPVIPAELRASRE